MNFFDMIFSWFRRRKLDTPKTPNSPDPAPEPATPSTPVVESPSQCGCKKPLGPIVEIPFDMRGGECVTPAGLDIRFDGNYEKLTNKGFAFVGNLLKDNCRVKRNADGTFRIELPCTEKRGYKIHVHGYNFPKDSLPIEPGNVCASWNGKGTFRWFVTFHKLEK